MSQDNAQPQPDHQASSNNTPSVATATASKALDLSAFLDMSSESEPEYGSGAESNGQSHALATNGAGAGSTAVSNIPQELRVAQAPAEKLVDISRFPAEEAAKARALADTIDFSNTLTTIQFVDTALLPIAQISRQLFNDTTVGEAGEVGRVAAAVIDGVKILRIEDLQREATEVAPKAAGFMGKVFGVGKVAHSAIKGFKENRTKFLTVMDREEAKARAAKADLMTTVQLLDEQAKAVRQGVSALTRGIAAAQIALDRGEIEGEALRLAAVESNNAADAAAAMDHRNTLANFRGKIADLQESMISAATLIPLIASNRKAAETRIMKLSNAISLTLPRLMAIASQAVVQAETARAGEEVAKLDEANRQITALAGKGAHDAAVSAARSLGGDDRNIEALAQLAQQTIATMHEVLQIEEENTQRNAQREQQLIAVRDSLVSGMRSVQSAALVKKAGA